MNDTAIPVDILAIMDTLPALKEKVPVRNLVKALWKHTNTEARAELAEELRTFSQNEQDFVNKVTDWAYAITMRMRQPYIAIT